MGFGIKRDLVIFDVETTGFKAHSSEITEVGLLKIDGETFEPLAQFSTLIKIDGEIPDRVVEITGITKEMCEKHGMDKDVVKNTVSDFCKGCILVAHNAQFDLEFFDVHFGIEPEYFYDTLTLSRKVDPSQNSHKLGDICQRYDISLKGAHRALNDVFATKDVLETFFKQHKETIKMFNRLSSKYGLNYRPASLVE
ncbi:TPA: PolC-type DNA polymerase III [Streptococcus suis]